MNADDESLRLNRFLARAGYGSRRGVETLVNERRVAINGEVVTDLARRVDPARDDVRVDGLPVDLPQDFRVYAFHKPVGVVSTMRAQGGQTSLAGFALRASLPAASSPSVALTSTAGACSFGPTTATSRRPCSSRRARSGNATRWCWRRCSRPTREDARGRQDHPRRVSGAPLQGAPGSGGRPPPLDAGTARGPQAPDPADDGRGRRQGRDAARARPSVPWNWAVCTRETSAGSAAPRRRRCAARPGSCTPEPHERRGR